MTYTQDQQRLEETITPGAIDWSLLHEKTDALNLKMLAQDPINGQKTIYNPETKKIFIKKDEVIPYNNTLNPVKTVFVKYNQEKNGYGIFEKNENVPQNLDLNFSNFEPVSFVHRILESFSKFSEAPTSILSQNNSMNFNGRIDNSKAFTNDGFCDATVLSNNFIITKEGVIPIMLIDLGKHYKQGKTTFFVANDVRNKEKIFSDLTKKHNKRHEFSSDFFSYKIPKYIQKCAGENNKTRVDFKIGDNNEVYKVYIVERLPASARFGQVIIDDHKQKNKNPYHMTGITEFSVCTQDIIAAAQQRISGALDQNLEKKEKGTAQKNITFYAPYGQQNNILALIKKINFSLGKNSQIGLKSKSVSETLWGTTTRNKVFNLHNSFSHNHPMFFMTKDPSFQKYVAGICGTSFYLPKAVSVNYEVLKKKHGKSITVLLGINSFILLKELGSQILSGAILQKIREGKPDGGSWFDFAGSVINTAFLAKESYSIGLGPEVKIGSFIGISGNIIFKIPWFKIKTNLGIKTKFDAYEGALCDLTRKPTQIFLKLSRKLKLGKLLCSVKLLSISNFDKEKMKDFGWFKDYYKDSGKKLKFSSFYQINRLNSIKFHGIITDMMGGDFLQQPDFYEIFAQNTTDLYVQNIIKSQKDNTHSRFLNLKLAYNKSVLVIKVFGFNICIFYSFFFQIFADLMKINLIWDDENETNNNMFNIGFSITLSTPWFSTEISVVLPVIFEKDRKNYRILSLSFQSDAAKVVKHFTQGSNSLQENV